MNACKRFSVIVVCSRVVTADLIDDKLVLSWHRENRVRFKKHLRCSSIIVEGTIIRNILDIVFKVQTPVAPMKLGSSMDAAWEFVTLIEHQRHD